MASRVVRSSKYRHVFGTAAKKEFQYDGVKISRSAWDSNKATANSQFVACIWDAAGGGAFCVLNADQPGKLSSNIPLFTGHAADVLDIEFHPFNNHLIASSSEDGYAKIWQIPQGGLKSSSTDAVQVLAGHKRKVGTVNFHPTANNVLATTSTDLSLRIWDIEKGDCLFNVDGHTDIIQSAAWSFDGRVLATGCKDKKVRVVDPRTNTISGEVEAHLGSKGIRVTFLGNKDKLFTTGFSRDTQRQIAIWDPRSLATPISSQQIDTSSGILMPFYDNDTCVLFLAGRGDGNIRYYEIVDESPYIHFLSEYKSATPQRGMCALPKLGVDVSQCEIVRLLKLAGTAIEPISFHVPRKSDMFQDDIFPPTSCNEPALNSEQWASGQNAALRLVSLERGFQAPARPAQEFKPVVKEVEGPKNEAELRTEYERLKTRVAYLEAEVVKRDARIRELEKN